MNLRDVMEAAHPQSVDTESHYRTEQLQSGISTEETQVNICGTTTESGLLELITTTQFLIGRIKIKKHCMHAHFRCTGHEKRSRILR
jgi:hypothetical protein